jgi:uncharacterized SAM-binding protein YcdF (DUF218 family)
MKWRIPLAAVSAVVFIWGSLPYYLLRTHGIGVIVPVTVGALGFLAAVFAPQTVRLFAAVRDAGRGVRCSVYAVGAVIALILLLFLVVSVLMLGYSVRKAPEDTPVTVVVLGAQVRKNAPSLMLRQRLDAALDFLVAHPDAPCVVSGGQGADEVFSEASVMRDYLINKGIDAARIYMEDASTNTMENLRLSRAVIEENGLPQNVVIATQEFHQYRAACYARSAGLTPVGTATCGSPWYLFPNYWIREFAAICRLWLLHY